MALSAQAQAVALLTAHLARPAKGGVRPLSPAEWGRFALWLKVQGVQPAALLSAESAELLAGWLDRSVPRQRIMALLARGAALALALERWERAGLWIMTRSDPDYPDRLKQRLKSQSPPLLFGCGNRGLLGGGGLAVVGSRDADESGLAAAARLGAEAAAQGLSLVSGGARGIDQTAMLAALKHEGTTIGVLADSLLRTSTSTRYREYLQARDLVLVSPFNPDAGFDVANAMARNRYIYCLADAAVVVASSLNRGGTWAGAAEDLKEEWVPLWVTPGSGPASGNEELVRRGARRLPDGKLDLSALRTAGGASRAEPQRSLLGLPAAPAAQREEWVRKALPSADEDSAAAPLAPPVAAGRPREPDDANLALDLYETFLRELQAALTTTSLTPAQLETRLGLTKTQLNAWLKRAMDGGRIEKLGKPVRYRWRGTPSRQPSIFDEVLPINGTTDPERR